MREEEEIMEIRLDHFSHPHPLHLSNAQSLQMTSCSACELQPHGWMYSCEPCNFTLHSSCTQKPNLINHPSHPIHPLTLVAAPPYPGGSFNCDGCGFQGTGFSYHCTTCDFDLHMLCATNPPSLAHQSHPHQLNLVSDPPYQTKGFSCHMCPKIGFNHWLHRCGSCCIGALMECEKSGNNRPSPHLQHTNSSPAPNNVDLQYQQQQQEQRRQQQQQGRKQRKEQRKQQKEQRKQQISDGAHGAGCGTRMRRGMREMFEELVDWVIYVVWEWCVEIICDGDGDGDGGD